VVTRPRQTNDKRGARGTAHRRALARARRTLQAIYGLAGLQGLRVALSPFRDQLAAAMPDESPTSRVLSLAMALFDAAEADDELVVTSGLSLGSAAAPLRSAVDAIIRDADLPADPDVQLVVLYALLLDGADPLDPSTLSLWPAVHVAPNSAEPTKPQPGVSRDYSSEELALGMGLLDRVRKVSGTGKRQPRPWDLGGGEAARRAAGAKEELRLQLASRKAAEPDLTSKDLAQQIRDTDELWAIFKRALPSKTRAMRTKTERRVDPQWVERLLRGPTPGKRGVVSGP
jgi:hypothetical protein